MTSPSPPPRFDDLLNGILGGLHELEVACDVRTGWLLQLGLLAAEMHSIMLKDQEKLGPPLSDAQRDTLRSLTYALQELRDPAGLALPV